MQSKVVRVREPCGCIVDHGNPNGVIPITFCRRSDHGKENCRCWRTDESMYQCMKHFWIAFVNNIAWDFVLGVGAFSAVSIGIEIVNVIPRILLYLQNHPTYTYTFPYI